MKNKKIQKRILTVAISILSCISLLYALAVVSINPEDTESLEKIPFIGYFLGISMASTCIAEILTFFLEKLKSDGVYPFKHFICAGILMISSVLAFSLKPMTQTFFISFFIYVLYHLTKRIFLLVARHKPKNIVIAVIYFIIYGATLLFLFMMCVYSEMSELNFYTTIAFGMAILIANIFSICRMAFSNINLTVMFKIIRKTYAMEILLGMLLLIIAFSFVFVTMEPAINNIWDGIWYCFMIVTTIGFGDITAVSLLGRALSVILGLYGIVVVALITSIIVNFYNEVKNKSDDEEEEQDKEKGNEQ